MNLSLKLFSKSHRMVETDDHGVSFNDDQMEDTGPGHADSDNLDDVENILKLFPSARTNGNVRSGRKQVFGSSFAEFPFGSDEVADELVDCFGQLFCLIG